MNLTLLLALSWAHWVGGFMPASSAEMEIRVKLILKSWIILFTLLVYYCYNLLILIVCLFESLKNENERIKMKEWEWNICLFDKI